MDRAALSMFKFIKHRIEHLDFSLSENISPEAFGEGVVGFESSQELLDVSSVEPPVPPETSFRVVTLNVHVGWDEGRGPFNLHVVMSGLFTHHPDMSEEDFTNFSEVLAPSILFSHLRPFVRLLTSEAGMDYQLPLINVTETIKKRRAAEAASQLEA